MLLDGQGEADRAHNAPQGRARRRHNDRDRPFPVRLWWWLGRGGHPFGDRHHEPRCADHKPISVVALFGTFVSGDTGKQHIVAPDHHPARLGDEPDERHPFVPCHDLRHRFGHFFPA